MIVRSIGRLAPAYAGLLTIVAAAVVRLVLVPLSGYDVRDYRIWAELVARSGVTSAYHADLFTRYNYPPIFLYILDAVDRFYLLFSPSFDVDSALLAVLLKTPAILADAAIAGTIYLFLRGRVSARLALAGALAYALNPAIIWNTGYWGGIDAIHSFFALLAVVLLARGLPEASWSIMTLSILTKPLSAPVAIVVIFLTLVRFGLRRTVSSAIAAGATSLVVFAPILASVGIWEMWSALQANVGHFDNISVNAHNFWWMVSGGYGWTKDTERLFGLISYRNIGLALFGVVSLWCLYLLRWRQQDGYVFGASALLSFAFFMLPTEVHENWMFGVFPFLAVASVMAPPFRSVLAALTVTFWLNMALHDLSFGYDLPEGSLGSFLSIARMANAAANNVVLGYGMFILWRCNSSAEADA